MAAAAGWAALVEREEMAGHMVAQVNRMMAGAVGLAETVEMAAMVAMVVEVEVARALVSSLTKVS